MLVSIILTCKIRNKTECHMTMASIDCIMKYTDPQDYELIVVDPEPSEPIRNDYGTLDIDKHLQPSPDPDYAACMNLGAKEAKGEYLVFLQNDVFVQEDWLPGLRQYLENGYDVVFPDQIPRDREYIQQFDNMESYDNKTWLPKK